MLTTFSSWLYSLCTLLGLLLTSLSIYVILTRSSLEMRFYKYSLLKLAICDLAFSLCLAVVVRPDLLFPLPGVVVNGLCSYFGRLGAISGICLTVVSGMTIFTAINDCCYTRAMLVYERHEAIQFIFSLKGLAVVISINLLYACFVVPPFLVSLVSEEEFIYRATVSNKFYILSEYPNGLFVGVSLHDWRIIPLAVVVGGGLFLLHLCNFIASFLTLRRLSLGKEHMSERTFHQHRLLTIMLICQNLYPIIAISLPCLIFGMTTQLSITAFSESEFVKHTASLAVVLYSAISSSCNFYFVRPYREFMLQKLRRFPILNRIITTEVKIFVENSRSRTLS